MEEVSCGAAPARVGAPQAKDEADIPVLRQGDRVQHETFGVGRVVMVAGQGRNATATVHFETEGEKRLLLRYAPVTRIDQ